MIITLSSMIGVPKICIRTDRNSRTNTGHSRNLAENIRFPADSLGPPYHHAGLSLVPPVVTLAEAAEYPLEDFPNDPEHGDYHYYFHTAIYFYVIIYLLKYVITQLNNYIITYLYIFVLQLIEPVLVLFDVCHDNGCRQRP